MTIQRSRIGRPLTCDATPLARLIRDQGIPKYVICGAVGISDRSLFNYMRGTNAIPPRIVIRLAQFFDVEPVDIVPPDHAPPRFGSASWDD